MRSYFKNTPYLHIFFYSNILYLECFSAFWLRLVFWPRATVKYHCTTVLFSGPYEEGTEQFQLCLFSRVAIITVFSFVFDSVLLSSREESCRTFVVSENYLQLAAFVEF